MTELSIKLPDDTCEKLAVASQGHPESLAAKILQIWANAASTHDLENLSSARTLDDVEAEWMAEGVRRLESDLACSLEE